MAARLVVGLALFALCHSSPVLINEIRDGRALSIAKGSASGYGGENRATANVHGNVAHATGSTNGAGLARDGLYYPGQGQAIANAQTYDQADNAAIDIARAQGFYHPLHVAQPAVITYNQNFVPAEQLVYQPLSAAPGSAESSATINGASETSQSTATNNGFGAAESNAQTSGNYGLTNTNVKTFGGYNTADSTANTGLGAASVSSKASGLGNGYASSNAQTYGANVVPIAPIAQPAEIIVEPTIIAAKNQGFYNPATYGSASSNANVNGHGSAQSSAKTGPTRRSIHWHFGTAYDIPAGYGAIKSAAPVVYHTPVVYQTAPVAVNPYGTAKSSVNTHGPSSAQSTANLNAGFSSTRSTANSNNGGNANANADINNNGYSLYRSGVSGSGIVKTVANTNGLSSADSNANLNYGVGIAKSTANSNIGGSANANADINNNGYGLYRSGASGSGIAKTVANTNGLSSADSNANLNYGAGIAKSTANSNGGYANANADISNRDYNLYRTAGEGAQWGRTITDVKTRGFGTATSTAQGYQSGLKIADSSAKSNGWGSSYANSQSL